MKLQLVDALAVIGLRRGLDPECLTPERDFVQIKRQYLLFAEHAFDALGKDRLLDLARVAIFVGQKQVFRDLLGNRRGTARTTAAEQIVPDRRGNPGIVDAAMAEKRLVLRREIGAHQHLGEIGIF